MPVVTAVKPSVLAPEYHRAEDPPRTVLLSGARFFDSSKLRCRFELGDSKQEGRSEIGGGGGGDDGSLVEVLGRWLSSSLLLCPVPAQVSIGSAAGGTARRVRLSATNDGQAYGTTSAILTMAAVAVPFDLTPKLGSVFGGTPVSVLVNGLTATGQATCRFGDTQLRPATLSKPVRPTSASASASAELAPAAASGTTTTTLVRNTRAQTMMTTAYGPFAGSATAPLVSVTTSIHAVPKGSRSLLLSTGVTIKVLYSS